MIKFGTLKLVSIVYFLVLFATACGENGFTSFENQPINIPDPNSVDGQGESQVLKSILVKPDGAVLLIDEVLQFKAIATYGDSSEQDISDKVEWQSSNTAIGTFEEDPGKLKAIAVGNIEITAKMSGIEGKTNAVIVDSEVESIRISPSNALVGLGQDQEFQAFASFLGINAEKDITNLAEWSSASSQILEPTSNNGTFKGTGLGNTKVYAKFQGKEGSTDVAVAEEAMIEPSPNSLVQLTVNDRNESFHNPRGTALTAVWSSNDTKSCKITLNGNLVSTGFSGSTQANLTEESTFQIECLDASENTSAKTIVVTPTLPEANLQVNGSNASQDLLIGASAVIDLTANYVASCKLFVNDTELILDDTQKTLEDDKLIASTTITLESSSTVKASCIDANNNEVTKNLDLNTLTPQLVLTANNSVENLLLAPESALIIEMSQTHMKECIVKANDNELYKGSEPAYRYETVFTDSMTFSATCSDNLDRQYQKVIDVTLVDNPQLSLAVGGLQVGPLSIPKNSEQEITWSAINAASCSLKVGEAQISTNLAGATNYTFAADTKVSFTCENLIGTIEAKEIDVAVTTPSVTLFINGLNQNYDADPGEQVAISYTADNYDSCSLKHGNNNLGNQNPINYIVNEPGDLVVTCVDSGGNQANDTLSLGIKFVNIVEGLAGGHFDADAFSSDGSRLHHEHAYDEEYQTTWVVYHGANVIEDKLSITHPSNISNTTIFRISLGNAILSKGAWLKINDRYYNWNNLPPADRTYSVANINADELITELAVVYSIDVIVDGAIACSDPSEVSQNANNNRNGAFIVNLLEENNDNLLWEGVTYWHDSDCQL